MPQQFPCAKRCGTPLTVADNANGGLVTVNVDGQARAAHRECPTSTSSATSATTGE